MSRWLVVALCLGFRSYSICRLGQRTGDERAELTGPNPDDRGKNGSKTHLITERTGPPRLSRSVPSTSMTAWCWSRWCAASRRSVPGAGTRRRRPARLHGDKGYDYPYLRTFLRGRGIVARIARRGVESSRRLGRHRWVIERTVSWLAECRRLHRRYERRAGHFASFVVIAVALICYRRLAK